jgi:holo-ACP synthase CitX
MDIRNSILSAREERSKIIEALLNESAMVLSVKPNIPGVHKNSQMAYLLINAFTNICDDIVKDVVPIFEYNNDGPYLLFHFNNDVNPLQLKKRMIEIEENHSLGRLIDLDVYTKNGKITRGVPRKCYICDNQAFFCIRSQSHTLEQVNRFIIDKIKSYYDDLLETIIDSSILAELDLDPKFGLVTPKTSGSHKDMGYELMIKAKKAIIPHFHKMFWVACENSDMNSLIATLKEIGKSAEIDMFKVTNGVNAYKGLIFNLGIMVSALALKISRFNMDSIFDLSKLLAILFFENQPQDNETYGTYALSKFNVHGVRGEALSGYATVQKGLSKLTDLTRKSRMDTLIFYIINLEDTNLLKRCGSIQVYNEVKNRFKTLDIDNETLVQEFNSECIKNNLSFGGSADLLVLTVFIRKMGKIFANLV